MPLFDAIESDVTAFFVSQGAVFDSLVKALMDRMAVVESSVALLRTNTDVNFNLMNQRLDAHTPAAAFKTPAATTAAASASKASAATTADATTCTTLSLPDNVSSHIVMAPMGSAKDEELENDVMTVSRQLNKVLEMLFQPHGTENAMKAFETKHNTLHSIAEVLTDNDAILMQLQAQHNAYEAPASDFQHDLRNERQQLAPVNVAASDSCDETTTVSGGLEKLRKMSAISSKSASTTPRRRKFEERQVEAPQAALTVEHVESDSPVSSGEAQKALGLQVADSLFVASEEKLVETAASHGDASSQMIKEKVAEASNDVPHVESVSVDERREEASPLTMKEQVVGASDTLPDIPSISLDESSQDDEDEINQLPIDSSSFQPRDSRHHRQSFFQSFQDLQQREELRLREQQHREEEIMRQIHELLLQFQLQIQREHVELWRQQRDELAQNQLQEQQRREQQWVQYQEEQRQREQEWIQHQEEQRQREQQWVQNQEEQQQREQQWTQHQEEQRQREQQWIQHQEEQRQQEQQQREQQWIQHLEEQQLATLNSIRLEIDQKLATFNSRKDAAHTKQGIDVAQVMQLIGDFEQRCVSPAALEEARALWLKTAADNCIYGADSAALSDLERNLLDFKIQLTLYPVKSLAVSSIDEAVDRALQLLQSLSSSADSTTHEAEQENTMYTLRQLLAKVDAAYQAAAAEHKEFCLPDISFLSQVVHRMELGTANLLDAVDLQQEHVQQTLVQQQTELKHLGQELLRQQEVERALMTQLSACPSKEDTLRLVQDIREQITATSMDSTSRMLDTVDDLRYRMAGLPNAQMLEQLANDLHAKTDRITHALDTTAGKITRDLRQKADRIEVDRLQSLLESSNGTNAPPASLTKSPLKCLSCDHHLPFAQASPADGVLSEHSHNPGPSNSSPRHMVYPSHMLQPDHLPHAYQHSPQSADTYKNLGINMGILEDLFAASTSALERRRQQRHRLEMQLRIPEHSEWFTQKTTFLNIDDGRNRIPLRKTQLSDQVVHGPAITPNAFRKKQRSDERPKTSSGGEVITRTPSSTVIVRPFAELADRKVLRK